MPSKLFKSCATCSVLTILLASQLLLLRAGSAFAQMPATRPAGYVSDFAGVLTPAAKAQIESLCQELDEKTHAQLAVVTVNSLEGRTIEEFSVELATKWGIGYKGGARDEKRDRGVLLLLAVQDRQDRIEVGYSLEPTITDAMAGDVLRGMVPALRAGNFDAALWGAALALAQPIAQQAGVTLAIPQNAPTNSEQPDDYQFVRMAVLIVLALLFAIWAGRHADGAGGGRGRGPGSWGGFGGGWGGGSMGGGWSSGGGGWSSGGGGGFGGFGGGSFGGGGASGRW